MTFQFRFTLAISRVLRDAEELRREAEEALGEGRAAVLEHHREGLERRRPVLRAAQACGADFSSRFS